MNSHNVNASFQKLIAELYFVYGGLRFEKTKAGYVHNGVICRTNEEMDILVHEHEEALKNSIRKPSN